METEIDLHVDPQKASTRYLENLNAHLEGIREICTANGIQYQLLSSNEPLEFALLEFLNSRSVAVAQAELIDDDHFFQSCFLLST